MVFGIILWNSNIQNQINGIRYVQMKIGRPNHGMQRRTIRVIHFRSKVRPNKIVRETRRDIEHSGAMGVFWERQTLQKVLKTGWKHLTEVLHWRPVLQFQYHWLVLGVF